MRNKWKWGKLTSNSKGQAWYISHRNRKKADCYSVTKTGFVFLPRIGQWVLGHGHPLESLSLTEAEDIRSDNNHEWIHSSLRGVSHHIWFCGRSNGNCEDVKMLLSQALLCLYSQPLVVGLSNNMAIGYP